MKKRLPILLACLFIVIGLAFTQRLWRPLFRNSMGGKTVEERLKEYGEGARARMLPHFASAQVSYPPVQLVFLGIKDENRLEIYGAGPGQEMKYVTQYPILRASGGPGPKLREGDLQVPEGIYPIELLNPNSRFHLSLRIGYPNAFDREQAAKEGRTNLGGDIMIHGGAVSIGCLAMGDPVAEELFVLAADTGIKNIKVVLAPSDFRKGRSVPVGQPAWTAALYANIMEELQKLPLPKE